MMNAEIYTGLKLPAKKLFITSINQTPDKQAVHIRQQICDYFALSIESVCSPSRKRELAVCRQLCMYFIKKRTIRSLRSIGEMFGGRDHSTVIYACATIEDLMDTDHKFAATVMAVGHMLLINQIEEQRPSTELLTVGDML